MRQKSHANVRAGAVVIGAVSAAVLLSLAAPASAQRRRQQPNVVELKTYRVEGTIVALGRGWIRCEDKNGKPYAIKLDPKQKPRIVVSGTAEPEVLSPGIFVRFTAPLDKKGKPTEPIAKLSIFNPGDGFAPGIFPDDPTDPNGPYLVAGQIRDMKRGKVTLAAGNHKVEFELAESPEIRLEVSDYSIARQGDSIRVSGLAHPQRPQELIGKIVEIELRQPLSGPKKKTRGRARRPSRRSAKRSTEPPAENSESP